MARRHGPIHAYLEEYGVMHYKYVGKARVHPFTGRPMGPDEDLTLDDLWELHINGMQAIAGSYEEERITTNAHVHRGRMRQSRAVEHAVRARQVRAARCEWCRKPIPAAAIAAKGSVPRYCQGTNACAQAAYRARKAQKESSQ